MPMKIARAWGPAPTPHPRRWGLSEGSWCDSWAGRGAVLRNGSVAPVRGTGLSGSERARGEGVEVRITYYEGDDIAVIVLREPGPDTEGEIAGEDLLHPETGERVPGIVLHRDDAGELYNIEIYSGASKRRDLDKLVFERMAPGSRR